jgi:hypothetical protein
MAEGYNTGVTQEQPGFIKNPKHSYNVTIAKWQIDGRGQRHQPHAPEMNTTLLIRETVSD